MIQYSPKCQMSKIWGNLFIFSLSHKYIAYVLLQPNLNKFQQCSLTIFILNNWFIIMYDTSNQISIKMICFKINTLKFCNFTLMNYDIK